MPIVWRNVLGWWWRGGLLSAGQLCHQACAYQMYQKSSKYSIGDKITDIMCPLVVSLTRLSSVLWYIVYYHLFPQSVCILSQQIMAYTSHDLMYSWGQDYKEKHTRLKTNLKLTVLNNTKLRHFWAQIVSWAPRHARKTFSLGPWFFFCFKG